MKQAALLLPTLLLSSCGLFSGETTEERTLERIAIALEFAADEVELSGWEQGGVYAPLARAIATDLRDNPDRTILARVRALREPFMRWAAEQGQSQEEIQEQLAWFRRALFLAELLWKEP